MNNVSNRNVYVIIDASRRIKDKQYKCLQTVRPKTLYVMPKSSCIMGITYVLFLLGIQI